MREEHREILRQAMEAKFNGRYSGDPADLAVLDKEAAIKFAIEKVEARWKESRLHKGYYYHE